MPVLRRGDTGPAVAEVRARLATLGLLRSNGTHPWLFDVATDRAVREFQQRRGLSVDGVVGPETYRALEEAHWRLGDRALSYAVRRPLVGDDVAALQTRLLELGFDPGRPDGVFGRRTEQALRDFQRNVGLVPDGTCGPETFRALEMLRRAVVGGRPQAMRESERLRAAGPSVAGKVIVVDPGHGGSDPGVTSGSLAESDLVADIAHRIEGRLAALGAAAFLTHGGSIVGDDGDRAQFANDAAADLVLSLHIDGHVGTRANGVATYYFGTERGPVSMVGERLAGLVQRELVARTGLLDCRTHAKTWSLLRRTRMPAVLVSVGYLTNPRDAARLALPGFRDVVAEAITAGIRRLYLPLEHDVPTGVLRLPVLVG